MRDQPSGDIWILKDSEQESQHYGKSFRFDFSYITAKDIKNVAKDFVWSNYRVGNKTLNTLYGHVSNFKHFNHFAEGRSISTLASLNHNDISDFISYLRTGISEKTRKPLAYKSQKNYLDTLKIIIYWGQIHKSDAVPSKQIFTGNEYRGVNSRLKIDFIPDDILVQINESLINERDPYVKYGIMILQTTGMRMGDLLSLTIDCVQPHPTGGHTITWYDNKNRRARLPMPVRSECVEAVEHLTEITKELRELAEDSISSFLFIHRVSHGPNRGELMRMNPSLISNRLTGFIKRNNIIGVDGNLYPLSTRKFRRTLATDMLSKGVNINVIQEILGHTEPGVTKRYYADIKDKDRAELFKNVGVIGNIDLIDVDIISNPVELVWFKENKEKCVTGLSDGYCTKPFIENKICERLLNRQKCYTCNRYITTPEYLEVHRNHLKCLEKHIDDNAVFGTHYTDHFSMTIEVLKVIIEKLEDLKHDGDRSGTKRD